MSMQSCFAHISDLHLTSLVGVKRRELLNKRALGYLSWKRKRRFEHQKYVLEELRASLDKSQLTQLLITGDLTHLGLPQEFREAREWLEELGDPGLVALVPGNHDASVDAEWEQTFALWGQYMAADGQVEAAVGFADFPTLRVRGSIAFIGVSTACPKPPLLATGTVGPAQLGKLADLLAKADRAGLFRVVYLHHSPVVGKEKWRKRLTDAAAIQQILMEQGVELVLHGHGHRAHRTELTTRQGAAPVIAVPSASALGLHGADTAAYNCYAVTPTANGWQLDVETRQYCAGGFVAQEPITLALMRTRA